MVQRLFSLHIGLLLFILDYLTLSKGKKDKIPNPWNNLAVMSKTATMVISLIGRKVLDARRRGATTEAYVKGLRHKAQGTRSLKKQLFLPCALRPEP